MSIILVFLDIHTYLNKGYSLNLVIKKVYKKLVKLYLCVKQIFKIRKYKCLPLTRPPPETSATPIFHLGCAGQACPRWNGMSWPHCRADRREPRALQPAVRIPAPQQPSLAFWPNKKAWWIKFYFAFGTQRKCCLKNVKNKHFCENTNFIVYTSKEITQLNIGAILET